MSDLTKRQILNCHVFARTLNMPYVDYRDIAQWLGCYHYVMPAERKIDKELYRITLNEFMAACDGPMDSLDLSTIFSFGFKLEHLDLAEQEYLRGKLSLRTFRPRGT